VGRGRVLSRKAQRIFLIGHLPPLPGGGSISRANLLRGFAAAGREVVALSPILSGQRPQRADLGAHSSKLRVERFPVERYVSSYPTPTGPESLALWRHERDAFREIGARVAADFQPDVVVAGREDIAGVVLEVAEAADRPLVTMVRGAATAHLLAGSCEPERARLLLRAFERSASIVTVADNLTRGLERLGFSSVRTAPNAVSAETFRPRPRDQAWLRRLDLPPVESLALYSGRIAENKRPLDIVAAARIARERGCPATVAFCGSGPLEAECRGAAAAAGVPLRITGWLPQADVAKLTAAADVVTLASDAEGASRALLEGMCSERCVIASDVPSAREIVRHGENGLLFRLGDPGALADALVEALRSPDLRRRLGRAARRSVEWRRPRIAVDVHLEAFDAAANAWGAGRAPGPQSVRGSFR